MTIKMSTIMSNSVARFFFRFMKRANIVLSTGKCLNYERQGEIACIGRKEELTETEEQEMLQLLMM